MIQELARPTMVAHSIQDEHLEDPAALLHGLLVACAVSVPMWGALIWALSKVG